MKHWIFTLGLLSSLTACVTINIYFPAAAAEKAADKIIDDVWQLKNGEKKENTTDTKTDTKTEESAKPTEIVSPAP